MYVLIQLSALALLFRPFKAWSTLFYGRLMHILLIMLKFCFLFFCIVVKLNYYVKVWSICVSALLQLLSGCRAIKRRDIYGAWEQYLGLEHDDSAPKKSYAVNEEINCCFVEWMCKLRCNINKR
ncbi:uncharacterized protein [Glycine max]|uniref:uncharacterized protein isoform X1 n=1 Tax=Glycine max TaxID=3847 RepID=UPI001B355067|nr:uncharacterized protein LOC102662142 isoform X1 [Glycine max]